MQTAAARTEPHEVSSHRGRRIAIGVGSVLAAALLTWAYAPPDLIPDWAALGSAPNTKAEERIPQADGTTLIIERSLIFPEGLVRGLVGVRTDAAVQRVGALGSWYSTRVVMDNFSPTIVTADYRPGRVSLTVVLGRVVRAELKG